MNQLHELKLMKIKHKCDHWPKVKENMNVTIQQTKQLTSTATVTWH